ncbi:tRNA guanosine-2'-O-methyltransferase TRM11 [Macrophomina phaseolina MS6]|uniref:tRNA guanosine-2'-O-methyltransferase TRM11 n=1 Tax=Macrophomina phaseolina (strain MS6) TaxID=1126212 RepID=K2RAA4_MACPH|nr:tRNA guanosine-2'-O-methyltransferase TRM11 [Macrophomina phaseolina MS6]
MPEYLIRCVQQHESFRKAELEALATLTGVGMEFISYSESTPFALVTLPSDDAARALITRSILSLAIYELWGSGATYPSLHASVTARTSHRWAAYATTSFRFSVDAFQGKRSTSQQRDLINSFRYLSFRGPIRMRDASLHLCIFEEYEMDAPAPTRVFLGRWIADGGRRAVVTYDLKKRAYISTTSMDAELALVTANMALAAPGKEGLKVLGRKDGGGQEAVMIDGVWAHLREGYIPPKKPYSFEAMLDDIMEFATDMLVDEGRLSMWMPTANDEDVEFAIPSHPCLQLVSVCVQPFNKWSRRLLTYRRIPDAQVDKCIAWTKRTKEGGGHADDLNSFRRKYFQGFKTPEDEVIPPSDETSAAAAKQGAEQLPEQASGLKLSDEDANQKSESK